MVDVPRDRFVRFRELTETVRAELKAHKNTRAAQPAAAMVH